MSSLNGTCLVFLTSFTLLRPCLHQLPTRFLQLIALLFYKPLAHLFNVSLTPGAILHHWNAASICLCRRNPWSYTASLECSIHLPVAKKPSPASCLDYWPVSITQSHLYLAESCNVLLSGNLFTQCYSLHCHHHWYSVTSSHSDPQVQPLSWSLLVAHVPVSYTHLTLPTKRIV